MTFLNQASLGIIGGADGPTAVFVSDLPMGLIAVGVIAGLALIALFTRNR